MESPNPAFSNAPTRVKLALDGSQIFAGLLGLLSIIGTAMSFIFALGGHDNPNSTGISNNALNLWIAFSLSPLIAVPIVFLGARMFDRRALGIYLILGALTWDFIMGIYWLKALGFFQNGLFFLPRANDCLGFVHCNLHYRDIA